MAKPKSSKKKQKGFSGHILGGLGLLAAIIFMPTTILLFFGMIPTLVAAAVDRTRRGTKALTVGAMNIAGCTPFLLELWMGGHSADQALSIAFDPVSIIVMWGGAIVGYMIHWSVSGIVTIILMQRTEARLREIEKRQDYLVERWGGEVTGLISLDEYGFPLDEAAAEDFVKNKAWRTYESGIEE